MLEWRLEESSSRILLLPRIPMVRTNGTGAGDVREIERTARCFPRLNTAFQQNIRLDSLAVNLVRVLPEHRDHPQHGACFFKVEAVHEVGDHAFGKRDRNRMLEIGRASCRERV